MVDERDANAERVAEVHRGHGGEGVDEIAFHENGLAFVVAYRVEETVFFWQETWWHARVDDED